MLYPAELRELSVSLCQPAHGLLFVVASGLRPLGLRTLRHARMAARRLSDSDKQELVARYRAGEATSALAEAYGCSANTVSRTVKSQLSPADYAALKANRQNSQHRPSPPLTDPVAVTSPVETPALEPPESEEEVLSSDEDGSTLALDDADDFNADLESEDVDEDAQADEADPFRELIPLAGVEVPGDSSRLQPKPLTSGLLPGSVYMLVDKVVELDARPLKEFPELGPLDDTELERHGLCLFSSPRTAKRQCGRSQRVIKVPDTAVFERTSSYLLARGITRLVMEGSLIALDVNA